MISGTNPQTPSTRPARRRNPRAINSCLECRERKSKCSRNYPCESCVAYGRDCVFIKDPEIEQRKSSVTHTSTSPQSVIHISQSSRAHRDLDSEGTPPRDFEWESYQQDVVPERDLYASLAADTRDAGVNDDREEDESMDLVLKFGRMVVTHRIEGMSVAHYARDLGRVLSYNNSSSEQNQQSQLPVTTPYYTSLIGNDGSNLFDYRPATAGGPRGLSISRAESGILYDQYVEAVHPVVHVVHLPSFKRLLDEYWTNQASGRHNTDSTTALIASVAFAAGTSMSALQTMAQFRTSQADLTKRLRDAAEDTLRAANCLSTSSVTTLQALTIYLMVQCRSKVLRSHSALVGALIRLGQGIGLHRKHPTSALTHLQRHVRSLLWYNICLLDIKTAQCMGVQPLIRSDDFDVPLPFNMDSTFYDVPDWQPMSVRNWTDMTFPLINFHCNELRRLIFRGTVEVAKGNLTLTQLKHDVDAQKTRIQQQWLPLLDQANPPHRYASLVMKILIARSDLLLLIGLLPKTSRTESETRLRDILIHSALITLEIGATLETNPTFANFAWFSSFYQSYTDTPLLIAELYRDPGLPDAKRIATMLDHVFGHCYGVSTHQRCEDLLRGLKECLDGVHRVRCMKAPVPAPALTELPTLNTADGMDRDIVIQWDGGTARPSGSDLDSLLNTYPQGFDMSGPPSATEPMDGIFMPADGFGQNAGMGGGEWMRQGSGQWGRGQFDFGP